MGGMEFEYDEKGSTFYYFLVSFVALVIIPSTYYGWPNDSKTDEATDTKRCNCDKCKLKRQQLKSSEPWKHIKRRAMKFFLVVGWIVLLVLLYKVSTIEVDDHREYDPYAILEIDRGTTEQEIKRAYRTLSKIYHPDRGGDAKRFLAIAKAYSALTDPVARKNWEDYGNPDGPGVTRFGIALPAWIIQDENSYIVLALYLFVFLVVLPVGIAIWWNKSMSFSGAGEPVLMVTRQYYYQFLSRTPNMILKRAITILAASPEFERSYNPRIVSRVSDNESIPLLLKQLPTINIKSRERPFCYPYSVKARALIYAHLSRLQLLPPHNTLLETDQAYILSKSPVLLNEMLQLVAYLISMSVHARSQYMPKLETAENIMKVSQMLVQGLWQNKSALLQLPHLTEDMLRHFVNRRRNIRSLRDFVRLSHEDRAALLRQLSDSDIRDVMNVCTQMPHVSLDVKVNVMDDEDEQIVTANSIVTIAVNVTRTGLAEHYGASLPPPSTNQSSTLYSEASPPVPSSTPNGVVALDPGSAADVYDEAEAIDAATEGAADEEKKELKKVLPWEKHKKPQKKQGGKAKKKKPQQKPNQAAAAQASSKPQSSESKSDAKSSSTAASNHNDTGADVENRTPADSDDEEVSAAAAGVEELAVATKKDTTPAPAEDGGGESGASSADEGAADGEDGRLDEELDDDAQWEKFQESARRENSLEGRKERTNHAVHCPWYPEIKYEGWWLYVADRKMHMLLSAPTFIHSLKDTEEVFLKIPAPPIAGVYQYTVCLRSDSYFDVDTQANFKLDVKEARVVEDHPQWNFSGSENEDEGADGDFTDSDSDADSADYDSD